MKLLILLSLIVFCGELAAQTTPSATPDREEQMRRARQEEYRRRETENGHRRLRGLSADLYRGRPVPGEIIEDVRELYREPTSTELKSLPPENDDLVKYASFLRSGKTGLVRLVENAGCGDSTKVLAAAGPCLKYSMPGNGSSYSFREGNYRLARLADLIYDDGKFVVPGVLQHGILVGIGDIPLESVNANTKGLSYVLQFVPATDRVQAAALNREISFGIDKAGFYYARELRAAVPMTYVLRSVAYRGSFFRSIGGIVYDELDFDKRIDITVAFRIVRMHDDGSITILWREIAKKESPKLKPDTSKPSGLNSNGWFAEER